MSNFDPKGVDWSAGLLAGWTYDKPVNKWFQGQFRSGHRISRPCPTCRDVIVLDVTTKALTGEATNHGLSLRRCKTCRKALKATGMSNEYAERKALGAERRAAEPEEIAELEKLRKEVAALKSQSLSAGDDLLRIELDGLYDRYNALRTEAQNGLNKAGEIIVDLQRKYDAAIAENSVLKGRLSAFDLPAAMAAAKNKLPWDA